jgi:hypothetical protein
LQTVQFIAGLGVTCAHTLARLSMGYLFANSSRKQRSASRRALVGEDHRFLLSNWIVDETLLVESSQGVPIDSFPRAHSLVESQIEHCENSRVDLLGVDVHGHLGGSCDAQH